MLQLRKILLSNKFYLFVFLFVSLITIIRLSIPQKSNYKDSSKYFSGKVIKIIEKDNYQTLTIKNKETLIGTTSKINVHLGDQVKGVGVFQKPSKNTTKDLFNYEDYCKKNHIFYTVKISSIKVTKKNHNIIYKIKEKINQRGKNNPYINTFLLGDKSYLSKEAKDSYQENGISHLFAISGMHIALLAKMIEKILKKLKRREETIFKITTITLLFYLLLVGFSPSIVRGILFYIGFSINRIYYFYINPKNLFLLLFSISLFMNPYNIYNTGFQYSYLISFSLIAFQKYLQSKNYFISLLKVSFLSFIVSIPITSYYFNQINLLSIIYNLFFVPLVSLIIFPFTLIIIILKPLEPIYIILTNFMENTSILLSSISFGKIILKQIPIFFYFIYLFIVLLFLLREKKEYLYLLFILLFIHIIIPIFNLNSITFLDVGEGDSIYLHFNHKNIIIDTGGSYIEGNIVSNTTIPFLKKQGVSKIHFLVLSHGDKDHMGDAKYLINHFKVKEVILNCGEYNSLEKELIKELKKKKIKYSSCISKLDSLFFLNTYLYDNENDNSSVVYTEINQHKILLMGDASIEREKDIIENYNLNNIEILKVGHHGSKTSSSKFFLKAINPKYSIISVGKNNRYGHPNKEVLDNLKESKIYRTDKDGSIMFEIKNNKLEIETCSE